MFAFASSPPQTPPLICIRFHCSCPSNVLFPVRLNLSLCLIKHKVIASRILKWEARCRHIAQGVGHWFLTSEARVQSHVNSCEIHVRLKMVLEQVYLKICSGFPYKSSVQNCSKLIYPCPSRCDRALTTQLIITVSFASHPAPVWLQSEADMFR
jgi:hypothetical protein